MSATLLIYFILTATHRWEFFSIETVNGPGSKEYCTMQALSVELVFKDQPGNMRVVCADDLGVES